MKRQRVDPLLHFEGDTEVEEIYEEEEDSESGPEEQHTLPQWEILAQFCKKLCISDVYQFRRALRDYHIKLSRNFQYRRNCRDKVIVKCTEEGCPFYMVASEIAQEKTFCVRKINLEHTYGAHGESTKVTIDSVARACEQTLRSDPRAGVDTIVESTKVKYGVEVPKSKAYRARKKVVKVVQGDHKAQYTRLRDFCKQSLMQTLEIGALWLQLCCQIIQVLTLDSTTCFTISMLQRRDFLMVACPL